MTNNNPESFVIDKINRLERDWDIQDEIVDWQLNQGRSTGEYHNQTRNEPEEWVYVLSFLTFSAVEEG